MASMRAGGRRTGVSGISAVLAILVGFALAGFSASGPAASQVVGRTPGPGQGLPPPPVNTQPYQPQPGPSQPGKGSLTPSWTAPSAPVPKVEPRAAAPAAAAPAAAAPAARAPRRLCEVAPGAAGCRGSGPPDGGGSDDNSCNCARDLCRTEQLPGQSLTRRYCYKAQ